MSCRSLKLQRDEVRLYSYTEIIDELFSHLLTRISLLNMSTCTRNCHPQGVMLPKLLKALLNLNSPTFCKCTVRMFKRWLAWCILVLNFGNKLLNVVVLLYVWLFLLCSFKTVTP